jgi:hypothetical protein
VLSWNCAHLSAIKRKRGLFALECYRLQGKDTQRIPHTWTNEFLTSQGKGLILFVKKHKRIALSILSFIHSYVTYSILKDKFTWINNRKGKFIQEQSTVLAVVLNDTIKSSDMSLHLCTSDKQAALFPVV